MSALPINKDTMKVAAALLVVLATGCGGAGSSGVTCEQEGVVLEEGLRIRDVRCGSGRVAERGMSATVNYELRLADGQVITQVADDPYTFRLGAGQVVPGWDEGLVGMAVGGTRQLVVPPELAYGEAGLYPDIPPNATVTFEVELLRLADLDA